MVRFPGNPRLSLSTLHSVARGSPLLFSPESLGLAAFCLCLSVADHPGRDRHGDEREDDHRYGARDVTPSVARCLWIALLLVALSRRQPVTRPDVRFPIDPNSEARRGS